MALPSGYSFKVPVERERDALRFFYLFMTCPWLVNSECYAFPDSAVLIPGQQQVTDPTVLTEADVGTERQFIGRLTSLSPGAIRCVAAFDEGDTKRVNAYYLPGSYAVTVVFAKGWKPTDEAVLMISSLFDTSHPQK